MTLQRHIQRPPIVPGYILNPERGHWSVEIPAEATNYIINPSAELATDPGFGWTGTGGGVTAVVTPLDDYAFSGLMSIQVSGADGGGGTPRYGRYTQADLAAGVYRFSAAIYYPAGGPLTIILSGTTVTTVTYTMTIPAGVWTVVDVPTTISVSALSTVFRADFYSPGIVSPFYVDALLLEQSSGTSTFFDGDTPGCYWLGTPRASASVRTGDTTSGIPVSFDDLGFLVDGYTGTGMPTLDAQKTDYAILDGATYDGTRVTERVIGISGRFSGPTYQDVQQQRAAMIDAINRDRSIVDLPLTLRYQAYRCGVAIGKPLKTTAVYIGGLEGNVDNNYAEQCIIQFRCDDPYFYEVVTTATTQDANQDITMTRIIRYDENHIWSNLGSGPDNGTVYDIIRGSDGYLYVSGSFTSVNGIPQTRYLAKWLDGTWSSVGNFAAGTTGTPGIYALAVAANGDLYVGGDFASVNGLANTKNIARYATASASFASIMTTGANNIVRALAFDGTGLLYIGGDFTAIAGSAINYLAQYNTGTGATGVVTATGPNNPVFCAAVDSANNLYIGGTFTTVNAVSALRIAKWNRSVWAGLSTGVSTVSAGVTQVLAIVCAPNGLVYAGGNFQVAGGVNVYHIAAWTGSAWVALGPAGNPGLTTTSAQPVRDLSFFGGVLYVSGFFTATGASTQTYRNVALWNGYTWLRPDVELAGFAPNATAIYAERRGLTIGTDAAAATATTGTTVAITPAATSAARPVVTILNTATVPIRLYHLINVTTGRGIYLDLIVLIGETITIDLLQRRISSNIRGDLTATILAGSDFTGWALQPIRTNYVNVYAEGADNTFIIRVNNPHWSVDGGVLR